MKNIKNILKKSNSGGALQSQVSRITNETVAEHREKILAGGRRFKYPIQYSRHKLVINSILIGIGALAISGVAVWWQLYSVQNTSELAYRITQLLPLPVASVDGELAKYSDYLLRYRSSIYFLSQQETDTSLVGVDGQRQINFIKRRELDKVLFGAYVNKVARELSLSVSSNEVNDFINKDLANKSVSLDAYEATVLRRYYNWSLDEYRGVVASRLLERKVSFEVDDKAKAKISSIKQQLDGGGDFAQIASQQSDDIATKASGGLVGTVPLNNQDPNGLVAACTKMAKNTVSGILHGSDGYYIVKLNDKSDVNIQYSMIKVTLSELASRYEAVKKAGKIHEYIPVNSSE
jgi:hypothetical protein